MQKIHCDICDKIIDCGYGIYEVDYGEDCHYEDVCDDCLDVIRSLIQDFAIKRQTINDLSVPPAPPIEMGCPFD